MRQYAASEQRRARVTMPPLSCPVTSNSYLKLLPPPLADAISRSTAQRRYRFAVSCARLAVDHCAFAVLALDDSAKQTMATLRDRAFAAIDNGGVEAVDRELVR